MTEQTINALCEKFHTTVDNLIPVYSQYAMSKDIVSSFIYLLIIIIGIIITLYIHHHLKTKGYTDWLYDTPVGEILLIVIAWTAIIICIIALTVNIYDYILWTTSPQMRFFDYIMHVVE